MSEYDEATQNLLAPPPIVDNGRMLIETPRLSFREMTPSDRPALAAILQDAETMTAYEGPFTDDEVDAWLTRMTERYGRDGFGMWAVILRASGEMIGQCGLTWQDQAGTEVLEIGYLFNRDHWHKGYASEAAAACKDYAFTALAAPRVYAHVRDTNFASMNVAIRAGMMVRGSFVKTYRGVVMPHLIFASDRP